MVAFTELNVEHQAIKPKTHTGVEYERENVAAASISTQVSW